MPDKLGQEVQPGDALTIQADTWNAILRGAKRALAPDAIKLEGRPALSEIYPTSTLLIRNDTGSGPLAVRAVFAIGAALTDVAGHPEAFQRRPVFAGTAPAAVDEPFAISIEPAYSGAIVRACPTSSTSFRRPTTTRSRSSARQRI